MEPFYIVLVIIVGAIIVALLIILRKAYKMNPYYQAAEKFTKGARTLMKEFNNKDSDYKVLAAIPRLVEDYKQDVSHLYDAPKRPSVRIMAFSKSNRKILQVVLMTLLFATAFSIAGVNSILMYLEYSNSTFQIGTLSIIAIIVFFLFISLIFSSLLLKKKEIKEKKKVIKLKKGIWIDPAGLVGYLGFSPGKNKYYEKGASYSIISLTILFKLVIFGLFLLSMYLVASIVLTIEMFSLIEVYNATFAVFIVAAMLYYLISMKRVLIQKFENFILFFAVLGIFVLLASPGDWKISYYISIFLICILLAIFGSLLYSKNRLIRKSKDFYGLVRQNLLAIVFLNFLFIDLGLFLIYTSYYETIDFSVFDNWIPMIAIIVSLVTILLFLKDLKTISIKAEFSIFRFLIAIITTVMSIWSFVILFPLIGLIAILIFFSSSIVLLITVIMDMDFSKDLKLSFNQAWAKLKKIQIKKRGKME